MLFWLVSLSLNIKLSDMRDIHSLRMVLKDLEKFRNVLFCDKWNFIHFSKGNDPVALCEISLDKALDLLDTFFQSKIEDTKRVAPKKSRPPNPIKEFVE